MKKPVIINATQAALVLKLSRQRINQLLKQGRFEGAYQVYPGGPWVIPVKDGKLRVERRPVGRPKKAAQ